MAETYRKEAKIYRFLFNATIIGIPILVVVFVYSITVTLSVV